MKKKTFRFISIEKKLENDVELKNKSASEPILTVYSSVFTRIMTSVNDFGTVGSKTDC